MAGAGAPAGAALSLAATVARVATRRWRRVLLASAILAVATVLALAVPALNSMFIETLIGTRPIEMLPRYLCCMVAVYLTEPLLSFVYVKALWAMGEEVVASLRRELFRTLLVQRIEFFDRHKANELGALLSVEMGAVRGLMTQNVSRDRGFRAVCECLGTLGALLVMAPMLAPLLFVAVVGFAATTAVYNRSTGPLFVRDGAAQGALSASAASTLGAIRTVRSFGGETVAFTRFRTEAGTALDAGLALGNARASLEWANRTCIYASLLSLFSIGGWLVRAGLVQVGALIAAVGYTFGLIFATQGVVNSLADLRAALAALGRARSLVTAAAPEPALAALLPTAAAGTTAAARCSPDSGADKAAAAVEGAALARAAAERGDITLNAVHFAYPTRPTAEVLQGVSLTLPHGKVTALVGSSGVGKSTVTQLLCRFYDPDAGAIAVGGADLSNFSRVDWLSAVALVGQEPVLFSGNVADNIRYGRAHQTAAAVICEGEGEEAVHACVGVAATDAEVEEAARAANAHDFISALPDGYGTDVGERGSRLSGGQRQRVAIARAILKDAPILILDEATSALDAESEAAVQSALDRLMHGRTTLIIAHRLATVQRADQIIVMGEGRVLESGRHEALMERHGAYERLVNSQRLSFEK